MFPFRRFCCGLVGLFFGINTLITAQDRQLVWADEFNGTSIDRSVWQFESGPSNDNVHFYTDRPENARVSEDVLQIIALEESYQGFGYTSAHIRTEKTRSWRYGRMEARIRLPGSPGFVPAFWMLPADHHYGWWPFSGEIDIMEHPTNEVTHIYGTVHTEFYNLFSGSQPPEGGALDVPDAESAFHVYAVEWSPDRIDFFVDEQKYFSFFNGGGGKDTWPFDQPFYLILNLAVGGGWVGDPDESTVFPAIMEVDYVRVYQHPGEMEIMGPDFVTYNTSGVIYHLEGMGEAGIQWSVPGGAQIVSGQGTPEISVDWGIFGGQVIAEWDTGNGTFLKSRSVRVSDNLIMNPGFEKGVSYWRNATGYPARARFLLRTDGAYSGLNSVYAEVTEPGGNPWDVQLSQQGLMLEAGTRYSAGIVARSGTAQNEISAAVINSSDFALLGQQSFVPGQEWRAFTFDFTAPSDVPAGFNIDLGGQPGEYFMDDLFLTTPSLSELNLVKNPDFFQGEQTWELKNLSTAVSTGMVEEGAYVVSIAAGGENIWDIHLGQEGLTVENGFEYQFSFDAWSGTSGQITPLVGKNSEPWTVYSDIGPVSLSSVRQTHTYHFTMNEPTDFQARLGFDMGGDAGEVYLDNILFRKLDAVNAGTSYHRSKAKSAYMLKNYPNPAGGEAVFSYVLDVPAHVKIQVFSITAHLVSEVVNEYQQAGEKQIHWLTTGLPAGVYHYRFETGEASETRKLVITR